MKQRKYEYEQGIIKRLTDIEKSNPREFWKLSKQLKDFQLMALSMKWYDVVGFIYKNISSYFNPILTSGKFPSSWNADTLSPLHKKAQPSSVTITEE